MSFSQTLTQFKTKDGLNLPGILFEPVKATKKIAIFLHGNGSSDIFYKQDLHLPIAEELARAGIAYFPFNNRGAHYVKSFSSMVKGKKVRRNLGMAFEMIRDCVQDIDAAVAHLRKLGFEEFYLLGHSTGANKICLYNYLEPKNPFSKFILLGPGDDTGLYYDFLGKKKFFETLALCEKKIQAGKGTELISRDLIPFSFISYASLLDTIDPDGDYNIFPYLDTMKKLGLAKKKKLWREYQSLTKPTLVVMGSEDEYCFGNIPKVMEILKDKAPAASPFVFESLLGADHGFFPKYKQLAGTLVKFLVD